MDVKKILLISLIAVAIVASVSVVSAGLFDGLWGGEETPDNVIEIDCISFNTTNVTKFKLFNQTEDEDGYAKWYIDENDTGYNVHIYNYSYVDEMTWNEIIKGYNDYLSGFTCQTVDGIVIYNITADMGNHVGEARYMSFIQNNDSKVIVDFGTPNINETVKIASTLKFK